VETKANDMNNKWMRMQEKQWYKKGK